MCACCAQGLADRTTDETETDQGSTDSGSTDTGTKPETTVPDTTGQTPAELLARADELFAEADTALGQSPPDFTTFQEKQAAARELIRQALAAIG